MNDTQLTEIRKREIIRTLDHNSLVKMPPEMANCAKEIVKDYVLYHSEIIDLCHKIENEFSVLILLQFICSCGMICFLFYQMYDVSTRHF